MLGQRSSARCSVRTGAPASAASGVGQSMRCTSRSSQTRSGPTVALRASMRWRIRPWSSNSKIRTPSISPAESARATLIDALRSPSRVSRWSRSQAPVLPSASPPRADARSTIASRSL